MENICHLLNLKSYNLRWKTQSQRRKTFHFFLERCDTQPACFFISKATVCICVSMCVCVYMVRLPVHFTCSDRLNRVGSHTTCHQTPPKALVPANVLLIDWCHSHCACNDNCALGTTSPVSDCRRRSPDIFAWKWRFRMVIQRSIWVRR